MKTWYVAVCDACGEAIEAHVNGSTDVYLGDADDLRRAWYDAHHGCELRLVWRDDQWDALYTAGWERESPFNASMQMWRRR